MHINGWIVLNKPEDITSAQSVGIIKRKLRMLTGTRVKIGHTGTLDPFATGILPLAIGEATKLSQLFLNSAKSYEFTLSWGEKTDSADKTGNIINNTDFIPDKMAIQKIIPQFLREQTQIPPKYSALKVNGQRAYDLARQNINFELSQREIFIHDLKLLQHDEQNHQTTFTVTCSKGTYVRTLGEDIAEACGSLGHLSKLHRTRVGFFSLDHAIFPDIDENLLYKSILDITEPLSGISAISVNNIQEQALRFGQTVLWTQEAPDNTIFPVLQQDDKQQIVALASYDGHKIIPKRIFNL